VDRKLPQRTGSLYRAGVLFCVRAVSCSDAARAATSTQDHSAVVVSCIPGTRARTGVYADLQAHCAFDSRVAVRTNCRSSRPCSRSDGGDVAADSRRASAHTPRTRRMVVSHSERTHWFGDGTVSAWRFRDFLSRGSGLGLPSIAGRAGRRHSTRAESFRQHRRSGKSLCSTSCFVGHATVSSSHHGDSAPAAHESLGGFRSRAVANRSALGHDKNFLARRAACSGTGFRAGAGTHVAFSTFRSGARYAAADLVSRILCRVQRVSVRFSSELRGKNNAVGDSSARGTVALLSGL